MVLEYVSTKLGHFWGKCRCAYSSTMVRIWDTGTIVQLCLLGGLEHEFNFSHHIGNFIIPTDFHSIIFQRGRYTINYIYIYISCKHINNIDIPQQTYPTLIIKTIYI